MSGSDMSRRTWIKLGGAAAAIAAAAASMERNRLLGSSGGRIRHSACQWCYAGMPLEELAVGAREIGLESIELIGPEQFKVVKEFGLTCAITWGTGPIEDCLNRRSNHDRCERELRENIDFAAAEKIPNVICFSGNRDGMDDEEGLENCAEGIKRVVGYAEEKGVTICLEMLNSKVDHVDYMADTTAWAVRLADKVGSERFKLLYDIYHMQIMEGDVIRTIQQYKHYFAHYHTGGVPGRNEIDDLQELNYRAIVGAIADTGYRGFLGQEFVPARDPMTSLAEAYEICSV